MHRLIKISTIFLLSVLTLVAFDGSAKAANPAASARAEVQAQVKAVKLTNQHTRADQEIERRISALNNLINRINAMVKVTDSQKSTLTGQVQAIITNLQTLKTKIDADTDASTLQADKKTIVTDYRIFVFMMPKVTIMAHADRILELAALLQAKSPSSDAVAKINDAITHANAAISTVSALDPSGWPGNKASMVSARQSLKTALTDLKDAWKLMKS